MARMSSQQVVTLIAVTTFSGRQFRGQVGEGRVCILSHQSQKVKADSDGVLADSNHLTLSVVYVNASGSYSGKPQFK